MKSRPSRRNSRLRRPFLAAPHPSALAPPVPPSRPAPFAPISTSTATSGGPTPPSRSATPSPPASPRPPRDELDGAAEFLVAEISMSDIEAGSDDGVDGVLRLLDAEQVTRAPMRQVDSTDVDRICAGMRSASWVDTLSGQSTAPSVASAAGDVVDAAEDPECEGTDWCHKEDLVIVDVFTSVTPERQKAEIARRLPKRKWGEVWVRFQVICNEMADKERFDARKAMPKAAERRLKPSSVIGKQAMKIVQKGAKTR